MDLQSTSGAANQTFKNAIKNLSGEMQICIDNCMTCHQVCTVTLSHCFNKVGEHVQADHLKSLIDCAQICTVSADFMSRESNLHPSVCAVCAEACLACAESCEKFANDEVMKNCAEMCRSCADSCKQMAAKH